MVEGDYEPPDEEDDDEPEKKKEKGENKARGRFAAAWANKKLRIAALLMLGVLLAGGACLSLK